MNFNGFLKFEFFNEVKLVKKHAIVHSMEKYYFAQTYATFKCDRIFILSSI